jgi:hypothetical protein
MHLSKMMYCQNPVATIPIVCPWSFSPQQLHTCAHHHPQRQICLSEGSMATMRKTTPPLQLQAHIVAGRFEVLSDDK